MEFLRRSAGIRFFAIVVSISTYSVYSGPHMDPSSVAILPVHVPSVAPLSTLLYRNIYCPPDNPWLRTLSSLTVSALHVFNKEQKSKLQRRSSTSACDSASGGVAPCGRGDRDRGCAAIAVRGRGECRGGRAMSNATLLPGPHARPTTLPPPLSIQWPPL